MVARWFIDDDDDIGALAGAAILFLISHMLLL